MKRSQNMTLRRLISPVSLFAQRDVDGLNPRQMLETKMGDYPLPRIELHLA